MAKETSSKAGTTEAAKASDSGEPYKSAREAMNTVIKIVAKKSKDPATNLVREAAVFRGRKPKDWRSSEFIATAVAEDDACADFLAQAESGTVEMTWARFSDVVRRCARFIVSHRGEGKQDPFIAPYKSLTKRIDEADIELTAFVAKIEGIRRRAEKLRKQREEADRALKEAESQLNGLK